MKTYKAALRLAESALYIFLIIAALHVIWKTHQRACWNYYEQGYEDMRQRCYQAHGKALEARYEEDLKKGRFRW